MRWSLRLGQIAGTHIYVHFTFFLLLGWVTFSRFLQTQSWVDAATGLLYFLGIAVIIVMHEFGHALAAKRYGIRTRDITLLPIGGVARLERMPEKPAQELVVALAGPAVNVVLAAGLFLGLALTGNLSPLPELMRMEGNLLSQLMFVNIFLALFNLVPAFPMDGGRVLRALLALFMDYVSATDIAARIGQGVAVLFVLLGLWANPMLILIGLFVWMGAAQEAAMVRSKSALAGVTVSRVMATRFYVLKPNDSLGYAANLVMRGFQHDFLVVDSERVVGVLTRATMVDALAQQRPETRVGDVMRREFETLRPTDSVEVGLERLRNCECSALPVVSNDRLVGIFSADQVAEYLSLRETIGERPRKPTRDEEIPEVLPAEEDEHTAV